MAGVPAYLNTFGRLINVWGIARSLSLGVDLKDIFYCLAQESSTFQREGLDYKPGVDSKFQ